MDLNTVAKCLLGESTGNEDERSKPSKDQLTLLPEDAGSPWTLPPNVQARQSLVKSESKVENTHIIILGRK